MNDVEIVCCEIKCIVEEKDGPSKNLKNREKKKWIVQENTYKK